MNAPSLDQRLLEIASRSDQCALLSKVLLITREMHHAAVAGDWDVVTEHEATRRDWIHACFESPLHLSMHSFSQRRSLSCCISTRRSWQDFKTRAKPHRKHAGQVHARKSVGHYLDTEADSR